MTLYWEKNADRDGNVKGEGNVRFNQRSQYNNQ